MTIHNKSVNYLVIRQLFCGHHVSAAAAKPATINTLSLRDHRSVMRMPVLVRDAVARRIVTQITSRLPSDCSSSSNDRPAAAAARRSRARASVDNDGRTDDVNVYIIHSRCAGRAAHEPNT